MGSRHCAVVPLVALALVVGACSPAASAPPGSESPPAAAASGSVSPPAAATLAADQVLTYPIASDLGTLDPAAMVVEPDYMTDLNLYDGLYKLDLQKNVVPDIAASLPDVSSDGMTFTMKLRNDVHFSNGDAVTSRDVLYSWNRAAAKQDPYAFVFSGVVGYDAVASGKAKTLSGLEAPDDYTVVAHLTAPAAYFLSELTLWSAWIVDEKVISQNGADTWWTTPQGLVGTGPFKMVTRTPDQLYEFAPVDNWWGGPTGTLKKVRIEIVADSSSQVAKFESGGYDLIGYAIDQISQEDALRYKNDPSLQSQLHIEGFYLSVFVGINEKTGPLAGQDGLLGRQALSLAIDRDQLANIACAQAILCVPATGGLITKGYNGYLGDNADPNAKFDAATAKADYEKWDPNHTKLSGVSLTYPAGNALYKAAFENVQAQWSANLGINISLKPVDRATYVDQRSKQTYVLFQNGWGADFDHPQNWFDSCWTSTASSNRTGFSNSQVDALAAQADKLPLASALPIYNQISQILIDQVAYAPLYYSSRQYLIKPYVQGAGALGGGWDIPWTQISILAH